MVINNPDDGSFKITFINNLIEKPITYETPSISMSASADVLKRRIDDYFWKFGANIRVTRTGFDADDLETTSSDSVVKYVYRIELLRRIEG